MTGKAKMKAGWISYFEFFPDYHIDVKQILCEVNLAVVYGYAGAGNGDKAWKIPAAWRAIIKDGKLSYGRCTPIQRFHSKEWKRKKG